MALRKNTTERLFSECRRCPAFLIEACLGLRVATGMEGCTHRLPQDKGIPDTIDRLLGFCQEIGKKQQPFIPTNHLLNQPESHQGHYDRGDRIQPIDIMEQYGLDYLEGPALKYLLRYRDKNGLEDLKKLEQYVKWLVEREKAKLNEKA